MKRLKFCLLNVFSNNRIGDNGIFVLSILPTNYVRAAALTVLFIKKKKGLLRFLEHLQTYCFYCRIQVNKSPLAAICVLVMMIR